MIRGYSDEGRLNVGFQVEPRIKRQLIELAYQKHVTASDILRQALNEKLARELTAAEFAQS